MMSCCPTVAWRGPALAGKASLIVCWIAALSLFPLGAAAAETTAFKITGIVISEGNGAPVPNCHLTATRSSGGVAPQMLPRQQRIPGNEDSPSTDTDIRGHFSLLVPTAGSWQVYAFGRGFRQQPYDRHEDFFSAVVLTPAAPTYDLVFRVEPDSAIAGFVIDEAGEGVRNARMSLRAAEAKTPDLTDGGGSTRAGTMTDDRGHYEFSGLAPGDYNVGVQAEPWYAAGAQGNRFQRGGGTSADPLLDVVYPQAWFPGVTDRRSAEVISLHHGEDRQVDFNLTPVPATHLRISAPSPTTLSAQRGQVFPSVERIASDGVPFVNTSVQIDPQGQIDIGGLSPGLYRVTSPGSGGSQTPSFIRVPSGASRSLDLSAAIPVANLTLRLQADGDSDQIQIVLTDVDSDATFVSFGSAGPNHTRDSLQRRPQMGAPLAPGGDRKLEVPPARYRVSVVGDGEVYLSSLSIGNRVVDGRIASLASGSTTLDLKLSRGRAAVRGVASLAGKPAGGAMVMLVPATFGQPASITILRRDQANTDGSFLIENVIPGDYILLAIDHGWTINWRDPSTLERFLTHGLPLALQSQASVKQDLAVQTP